MLSLAGSSISGNSSGKTRRWACTAVLDAAWDPLEHEDVQEKAAIADALAEWEALPKAQKDATPRPRPRRTFVISEATMAGLQECLVGQNQGIGVKADEMMLL